jgi:hypothetical protein
MNRTKKCLILLVTAALIGLFAACGDKATATDEDAGDVNTQILVGNPIDLSLDVTQGFNFRKDKMIQVGFVTFLKIGDTTLKTFFTVTDPENNENDLKVVGVISHVDWTGSATDPINFNVQVSETSRNALDTLTTKNIANIEVEFQFNVYHYDPSAKKYYRTFHTNETTMQGLIYEQGDVLAIKVDKKASMRVQEPRNYKLSLGIKPQPTQQELHYAYGSSVSDKLVLQWGVTK